MFRMNSDHGTVVSADSRTITARQRNRLTKLSCWKKLPISGALRNAARGQDRPQAEVGRERDLHPLGDPLLLLVHQRRAHAQVERVVEVEGDEHEGDHRGVVRGGQHPGQHGGQHQCRDVAGEDPDVGPEEPAAGLGAERLAVTPGRAFALDRAVGRIHRRTGTVGRGALCPLARHGSATEDDHPGGAGAERPQGVAGGPGIGEAGLALGDHHQGGVGQAQEL